MRAIQDEAWRGRESLGDPALRGGSASMSLGGEYGYGSTEVEAAAGDKMQVTNMRRKQLSHSQIAHQQEVAAYDDNN